MSHRLTLIEWKYVLIWLASWFNVQLPVSIFILQVAFYICFIPESDNEGQLFLSTTDNPDDKILICRVGKDHESLPMQFRKYVYCLDIDLYFKTKMIMIHFH